MLEKIIDIVSSISQIDREEIKTNKDKTDLWDSFSHIEIVMQLENEFNVRFDSEEIVKMKSINKIEEILKTKAAK